MSRLGASQIEITGGFAALASCGGSSTKKVTSGTTIPQSTQALILILILILGSNSNSIFKLVTALIVKAMRNKKRRRKIFIGPCTKQEYTERVFIFESFIKRTNFLQMIVSFGCLFGLFAILGHFTAMKEKARAKQKKTTCYNSSRKAVQKGLCKHLLSAIITLSYSNKLALLPVSCFLSLVKK